MNRLVYFLFVLLTTSLTLRAQVKIGDNLQSVNANSILELESTTKALLLPRLSNTQIQAMQNVPAGMLVYSNTDNVLMIRTNTGWTTLALAADAASATGPWSVSGNATYTTKYVGVGTSQPFSQLANNSGNTSGSDGQGGNGGSISWSASQPGYVGQIYNAGKEAYNNGLVVKVSSTTATALDVSQGPQNGSATPLLTVKSNGNVGIGQSNPTAPLDVNGKLIASSIYSKQTMVVDGVSYLNGNINSGGNINLTGSSSQISASLFNIGVQYVVTDYSLAADYRVELFATCPTGTKLIGGGAGHRDYNSAANDISIRYSGPDPSNLSTRWRAILDNTSDFAGIGGASRAVQVYAICAKVN